MSVQQFMDPRPSATLDVNEPSASDDKTQELSASPDQNNMEVVSKEREQRQIMIQNSGKHVSVEQEATDRTSQSWGSPKSPKLDHLSKNEEQVSEVPFRKARVSVRARSEAPLVSTTASFCLQTLFLSNMLFLKMSQLIQYTVC